MGTVHCSVGGSPAVGATVVVSQPPFQLLVPLGGLFSVASTDRGGNATFPDPTIWNSPLGSTADVVARFIDSNGNRYYAQSQWTSVTAFLLAEKWDPDPLNLDLIPRAGGDRVLDGTIDTVQKEQTKGIPAGSLDTAIKVGLGIALAGAGAYVAVKVFREAEKK